MDHRLQDLTDVARRFEFRRAVNPACPHEGIGKFVVAGQDVIGAQLLGVTGAFLGGATEVKPVDVYMRADNVAVAYEEPLPGDARVDAMWRTVAAPSDNVLGLVDLIVSVRTQSLDYCPDVSVQSRISAGEMLRLLSASPPTWSRLALDHLPQAIDPHCGTGCLLLRLREADLSYVEMIHPLDFQGDEVLANGGEGRARISRRLFRTHLEKGVILRARVRGAFIERRDDSQTAEACYAAFAASEAPLGT